VGKTRVLEIGEHSLFGAAMPGITDSYFCGYRAPHREHRPFFGLLAFFRTLRAVRRGEYDLVVVAPPFYPGWHPRSFLAAIKYTVFKGRPQELWGAIVSPLVFALLRFFPADRMIAIDRSDSFGLPRHSFFLLDKARAFFKRELPVDHWQALYGSGHNRLPGIRFRSGRRWQLRMAKLRPIPLGLSPEPAAAALAAGPAAKRHDIFFSGAIEGNSHVRSLIPKQLGALQSAGIAVDWAKQPVPRTEFLRRCAEAWLVLSPAGLGWDCYRHVEAALCGSVPLVSAPTIDRYRPFVIGEHCLAYYADENRMIETVNAALADKTRLAGMAAAAREHALANLTEEAVCSALLEEFVNSKFGTGQMSATV
jgi:glycosyltransferase involved in cell wall biosynthesis